MGNKFILRKVIIACESILNDIDTQRKEQKQKIIEQYRYERKYGFFGPKIMLSDEEALNRVYSHMESSYDYDDAVTYKDELRSKVLKIQESALALKARSSTDINLTIDEFYSISDFYKEAE